jgi:hypothetical protein
VGRAIAKSTRVGAVMRVAVMSLGDAAMVMGKQGQEHGGGGGGGGGGDSSKDDGSDSSGKGKGGSYGCSPWKKDKKKILPVFFQRQQLLLM